MTDPYEIIDFFYPESDSAREILLLHSTQVRNKALDIASSFGKAVDMDIVSCGAMLHDIGIKFCNAPDLGCFGEDDYILHGIIGAEKIRACGIENSEVFARICERHTGSGITCIDIIENALPMPQRDFLPETKEEQIICLADKFFSKSGDMMEKSVETVRKEMTRFGKGSLERFDRLYETFIKGSGI